MSDFQQNCRPSCLNHSAFFSRGRCSREKTNFCIWLSHCQLNAYVYSLPNREKQGQLIPHTVPEFNHISIKNQPGQYQKRPWKRYSSTCERRMSTSWITEVIAKSSNPFILCWVPSAWIKYRLYSLFSELHRKSCQMPDWNSRWKATTSILWNFTTPSEPTILSVKEDPRLPKELFIELKDREDVVGIVVFPSTPRNWKM